MPQIEFICLANSRKRGGRCVAGLRTDGRGWLRLVAPTADGTLTFRDYTLGDAGEARPMDVVSAGVVQPRPLPHQPENWVIDETPWRLVRRPAVKVDLDLVHAHLCRGPHFMHGDTTTLPFEELLRCPASSSLAVIRPLRPVFHMSRPKDRIKLRLHFTLRGHAYDLTVTDPAWESAAEHWSCGEHAWWRLMPYAAAPLVVTSITEPFGNPQDCYKIAATVWPGPVVPASTSASGTASFLTVSSPTL